MRAAANHVIQSSGATITKNVQRRLWDLQPSGVSDFKVMPMNIHDEILCPVKPDLVSTVTKLVNDTVEGFRDRVPLIKLGWKENATSWADLK